MLMMLSSSVFALPKYLNQSIVEILIDRHDEFPEYDRKIDKTKIPFAIRNSRYDSIGTAFFVSDSKLVTAAHVLRLRSIPQKLVCCQFFLWSPH